jgi:endonuclease/exonuclease/phosphatase family metal-dependent hydrolase
VLEHLAAGESLILMGDFNDGPGLDEYEAQFGRSGVEIVLGWDEPRPTRMYDPHARRALGKKLAAAPATARFYLAESRQYFSALLDYIMVSPDLRAKAPQWRIWHPFDDPECYADDGLRQALLDASDHFPVTLDIDL